LAVAGWVKMSIVDEVIVMFVVFIPAGLQLATGRMTVTLPTIIFVLTFQTLEREYQALVESSRYVRTSNFQATQTDEPLRMLPRWNRCVHIP
jgi:hypothetical protein